MSTDTSELNESKIEIFAQSPPLEGAPTVYLGAEADEKIEAGKRLRIGVKKGGGGIVWCDKQDTLIADHTTQDTPLLVSVPEVNEEGDTKFNIVFSSGLAIRAHIDNTVIPDFKLSYGLLEGEEHARRKDPGIVLTGGTIVTLHSSEGADQSGSTIRITKPKGEGRSLTLFKGAILIDHNSLRGDMRRIPCFSQGYSIQALKAGEWVQNLTAKKGKDDQCEVVIETNTGKLFQATLREISEIKKIYQTSGRPQGTPFSEIAAEAEWVAIDKIPDGMPSFAALKEVERVRTRPRVKFSTRGDAGGREEKTVTSMDVGNNTVAVGSNLNFALGNGFLRVGDADIKVRGAVTAMEVGNSAIALGTTAGQFLAVELSGDTPSVVKANLTVERGGEIVPLIIKQISGVKFDQEQQQAKAFINGQPFVMPYKQFGASSEVGDGLSKQRPQEY